MITALSLSGGKDSVAASLHLRELGIEHRRIFMDTGWEHPDLYTHLDYLEERLGPIERLRPRLPELSDEVMPRVLEIEALVGASPSAMVRWVVHHGMFPTRVRRWCTRELKVMPFLAWVDEQDDDVLSVVGIRADESPARANLPEREVMPGAEHVEVWRPLIRWTTDEVIEIHHRHSVVPCPLYLRGSTRVGCWPCIQANKGQLASLAKDDRRVQAIKLLEQLATDVAAKRGTRTVTMFQASSPVIVDGAPTYPPMRIDRVLEWAQTARGGRQMQLGGGWGQEAGCVRWGMCESSS